MSKKALEDYTFNSKYARYNKNLKRRENWHEAIERVKNMHLQKYPMVKEEINWAFEHVHDKLALGSQRALQFGGDPILKRNAKIYNCISSYCNRIRFFQECMWLLLNGCGTGFSVQQHHVNRLPNFIVSHPNDFQTEKIYKVEDSIEGWANALGVLLSSYLPNEEYKEYAGQKITFDYSLIRPKGSSLSYGIGKAPGHEPLQNSLEKIRELLNNCIQNHDKLRTIDAYDIVMHSADAVLSGGIRRSACLAIFSPTDELMLNAKTGNWLYENKQRARSNNSALLIKDTTDKKDYHKLFESTRQFGEPGMIWADNSECLFNPCVTVDTIITTKNGLYLVSELINKQFESLVNGKTYFSSARGFWKTGKKQVVKLKFESGRELKCTENHKILTTKGWEEAKDINENHEIIINDHSSFSNLFNFDADSCLYKNGHLIGSNSKNKNLKIHTGPWLYLLGLVAGYFDQCANVDISEKTIKFESKIYDNLIKIQIILNGFGIISKIKKKEDEYYCSYNTIQEIENLNEPYELIISNSAVLLFYNIFKNYKIINNLEFNKLINIVDSIKNIPIRLHYIDKLIDKCYLGEEDVYDCTVPEISAFDANGIYVHNCVEIGMYGYDENGNSGWQACNLSTINGSKIVDKSKFATASKAAAIIGTLQAGYDSFDYLGKVSENIIKREALLGVSITGIMNSPQILLDKNNLREMASLILNVNEYIADEIGINLAARSTCVKPEGTTSCMLGTSSGIHPAHAYKYIRRIQSNNLENPTKYFKQYNPEAVENSVWSSNNTDEVISFLIELPDTAIIKDNIDSLKLLETVKLFQENWVTPGKRENLCSKKWLNHNVSNTINVKSNEWEQVENYIYENRYSFAGISLLPETGDLDYPQAPFTKIFDTKELLDKYGDAILFCSGLIVDGLHAFEDNLWKACDALLGSYKLSPPNDLLIVNDITIDEHLNKTKKYLLQKDWLRRAKQFANRYVKGDIKETTYMLKNVNNNKIWIDLKRNYKNVEWENMIEEEDNTKLMESSACSGGKCELI
jgi:intein/homing endonuclease